MRSRFEHEKTLVEQLIARSGAHPERLAVRLLKDGDGEPEAWTYADLDRRARAIAARLQALAPAGERALLLYPTGLEYTAAFFGCMYAGMIAVPAYPPESMRPQHLNRLAGILRDATPRFILTESSTLERLAGAREALGAFREVEILASDRFDSASAADWKMPTSTPADIALLQYTSGSTATPKGVMVSHGNLIANELAIRQSFGIEDSDTVVSWLPLYHDMGLIGGLLQPIFSGISVVLMSPRHFLERPVRWLEAISRHGGTVSGGPDFAFRLCIERVSEAMMASLDLRRWRVAFSGAEPVRVDTLRAFAAKFGAASFDERAFYPCYGLAEATLLVSGGERGGGLTVERFNAESLAENKVRRDAAGHALAGCGQAREGHDILIVDPSRGVPDAAGEIGEICVSGPSVTLGYWKNPEATRETFVEREGRIYLRTGDLGFFHGEQLFISGRMKDMIVIRGSNLYPQDIEKTIEDEIELVRKGRIAAFAVEVGGREGIGVAVEVSRGVQKMVKPEALVEALREAVTQVWLEPPSVILLLNPGALPMTSSGKLQRGACRRGWKDGTLGTYHVFVAGEVTKAATPAPHEDAVSGVEREVTTLWREVLSAEHVGRDDTFFALGGDSVAAAQIMMRVQQRLGISVEPSLLFEAPSVRAFAAEIERRAATPGATAAILRIPPADRSARLPLSYAQQRLWFLAKLTPRAEVYTISGALRLRGALSTAALGRSIEALVQRHEALRTTFHEHDGRGVQVIHASVAVGVDQVDLRGIPGKEAREAEARALAAAEAERPFDLETGPLLRATLMRLGEGEHVLLMTMHHIVSDGWSMNVVIEEIATLYKAFSEGREHDLGALPIQYADYAVWQRSRPATEDQAQKLAYWKATLGQEHPVLELPTDRPRPSAQSYRGGRASFEVSTEMTAQLRALGQAQGATVFMVLLAAFEVLLYRYTGERDLRVGVPAANRSQVETAGLVGLFVNTQVLRARVDGRQRFTEVVRQVRESVLGAQAHQDVPFEQIVEALSPERSLSHHPLFQVMINHQKRRLGALKRLHGLEVEAFDLELRATQFDLTLDVQEDETGALTCAFEFATDLFEATTVARLGEHFVGLLEQLVSTPERRLGEIPLLTARESAQVATWATIARRYDHSIPVHAWIQRHAEARPEAGAVVCEGQRLSYGELEQQANRVAHQLVQLGVRPETLVGLSVARSVEMVVGMLGIWKAGGAYVPLDPEYPRERLAYMMADAAVKVVVTDRRGRARLEVPSGVTVIALDEPSAAAELASPVSVPVRPEHLAYMIYTSGSTGKPKGVAVAHGSLSMHCQTAGAIYGMTAQDCALHFASLSFDAAVEQWVVPLMHGGRLVVSGNELWSAEQTYAAVVGEGVSVIYPPTSHLRELSTWVLRQGKDISLRICTVGGEAVSRDSVELIRRALKPTRLINGYGPTETVITPLLWVADATTECETAYAPIGKVVGERTSYILDTDLNLVPVGVVGELYIGGAGLARGYHERPGLTAERFVPDPFSEEPGGRLYRTGDLTRWRADGTVEYVARVDHQVKIRGYRIELGEVEAQLLSQDGVREAVVVVRGEQASKRLVGYVVGEGRIDAEALTSALQKLLPAFMVPSDLVVLLEMPRTPNGKVDRKRLPEPERADQEYVAPQTEVERKLAEVWQTVLGVARVGATDNFFERGGDSIGSIQVVSRAREAGIRISPKEVFQHPTLQALARAARVVREEAGTSLPVVGEMGLTPIQAAFFEQRLPEPHHYNQAVLLEVRRSLETAHLVRALGCLLAHHDALRMRFCEEPGGIVQRYAAPEEEPAARVLWVRDAADSAEVERLADEAQRSLSFETGPLLRAVYMRVADGTQRLLLVIHHLVVDGVSWRVLLEDLERALDPRVAGQAVALPPKSSSFQRWSEQLRRYAGDEALERQMDHWCAELGHETPALRRDDPEEGARSRDTSAVKVELDRGRTEQLLKQAPAAYRTQINDLLLTALARALERWSGEPAVTVLVEGHGREDLFEGLDLHRTVGWFTTVYPVRLRAEADAGANLRAIKERLRGVPDRGLGFGVLKHLARAELGDRLRALGSPGIAFNYLGQLDASFADDKALFVLAKESSGQARSPLGRSAHGLEIDGRVYDGILSLDWSFDPALYRRETVEELAALYRQALVEVIEHCTSGASGVTPSDFALVKLGQADLDRLPLAASEIEEIYPLTPVQQGMLFHALEEPRSDPYFYQRVFVLRGALDRGALERAWSAVAQQHAALRTAFFWTDLEAPIQVVSKHPSVCLVEHDLRGLGTAEQQARLSAMLDEERQQGFDFARATETRLCLLRVSEQTSWLVWSLHHIALDGWSTALILGDVLRAYHAFLRGDRWQAAPSPSYASYVGWLQTRDHGAAIAYWHETLAGFDTPTPLPGSQRRRAGAADEAGYAERTIELTPERTTQLKTAARRAGLTVSTLLQGAWALVLGRWSDTRDVVFGVTVSGRAADLAGVERMTGLLINTLPLRVRLTPSLSREQWLRGIQDDNLEARRHEHAALADIQRASEMHDRGGLFDSIIVFENYPLSEVLRRQPHGLEIDLLHRDRPGDSVTLARGRNNYPLSLIVALEDTLTLTLSYRRSSLESSTAAEVFRQVEHLLGELTNSPARRLGDVALAIDEEPRWASGESVTFPFPDILAAFSHHVEAAPRALAAQCEEHRRTFQEIEEASNRVARTLLGYGVGPEARVGVCLERSIELVVGMLGILKAGGAYVPFDPKLPAERLRFLLSDSGAKVVLTSSATSDLVRTSGGEALPLDSDALGGDTAPLPHRVSPDQAAYVIYTSGSTGQPKGVVVSHRALSNYVSGVLHRLELAPGASMAMVSTVAADLGHTVLFGALCSGRLLHLISPARSFDPDRFADYMAEHQVGILKIVPSHLRGLLHARRPADVLPSHALILGGEASDWELVETARALKPGCRIINHYGPTETTVGVLTYEVNARDGRAATVPIGAPLPNVRRYVLDQEMNPVPEGVPGELYIGGEGVARGYHGRPGLTAERFVPDPFQPGERLYRTGDRVIHRAGAIEFLGRTDDQIKIRGYRVELGEITAALRGVEGVRDAVVIAAAEEGTEQTRLLGYYVPASIATPDLARVDAALRQRVPEYMVPALIPLERLPLTPNGKLDRRALPAPSFTQSDHVAPRTETEEALAAIWRAVLKVERVGVTDNLFELGGDSILALQIIARARKKGIKLTPKQLFETPTIAELVKLLDAGPGAQKERPVIPRAPRGGDLPLSHAQQRLWFLTRLAPEGGAYNIAGALRLRGEVNVSALGQSIEALVARHEALRTTFHEQDGRGVQVIHETIRVGAEPVDLTSIAEAGAREAKAREVAREEAERPFDLEQGPLLRVTLVRLSERDHVLLMTMHHIVSDGWSMNVLTAEFAALYAARVAGKSAALRSLPIQYVDYAVWQRGWLEAGERDKQLAYWRGYLGEEHGVLELPTDRPRPAEQSYRGSRVDFLVSEELTAQLRALGQAHGATLFMVLLAAFQVLLYRYTGERDVRVGVPTANRGRVETEGLVGLFVNTQVLRTRVDGRERFTEVLKQVRESVLGAQAHQDLPFEQLVEALSPERSLSHNPLFQVMYNHQKRELGALGRLRDLQIETFERERRSTQLDLSLSTEEESGALSGALGYATDLFDATTIARLSEHFQALLGEVVRAPERKIGAIALLSEADLARVATWNATTRSRERSLLVPQRIQRQAELRPDACALLYEDATLSYGALERRANQLAQRLVKLGVGPDVLVGISIERSLDLLVGLLGIMKAGGAYVPLDPDYPRDRLAYMMADADLRVLLTTRRVRDRLDVGDPVRCVCLDSEDLREEGTAAPQVSLAPEHLAYMIYTSGSTGRPKGAGNTHAGLRNRLEWMQSEYEIGAGDTVLQKTPLSFDVSVWELFWPLMVGARLAIAAPGDQRDPGRLLSLIQTHHVTTLHFVPSMLHAFMAHEGIEACTGLQRIICSGEALPVELQAQIFARLPRAKLDNLYGPTEASIDVTHWTCVDEGKSTVPIGRPIDNTAIYLLDVDLNIVPIGVVGELYIGGVGLARSYHGRPGLTSASFVPDPFGEEAGGRLYRTGDLARWRADGTIEYVGRVDHQVKIRGNRIELGEIEAQLLAQRGVREAVVVVRGEQGNKRLVGYVVAGGGALDTEGLKRDLRRVLPELMVPSDLVVLPEMPRTPNGKLDRKRLPEPERIHKEYVAPKTELETKLAEIWQAVLGVARVGMTDEFFELGGHSLLATQVISRIQKELHLSVPLKRVFEATTLARFAPIVAGMRDHAMTEEKLRLMDQILLGLEEP